MERGGKDRSPLVFEDLCLNSTVGSYYIRLLQMREKWFLLLFQFLMSPTFTKCTSEVSEKSTVHHLFPSIFINE